MRAALIGLLGLASPAFAENCRLALVLALDVSGSVDAYEDRLQREGLARALLAPEVTQAFLSGGPVALYVFEWSSPADEVIIAPGWQLIDSEDDLIRAAASVASVRVQEYGRYHMTALGSALSHAADALRSGPDCRARTVDVSGEAANNYGPEPAEIYARHLLDGVTVNALVIDGAHEDEARSPSPENDAALVTWFETEVLYGPGAFLVPADGYEDYQRAMTAKLRRELEVPLVSGWPTSPGAG